MSTEAASTDPLTRDDLAAAVVAPASEIVRRGLVLTVLEAFKTEPRRGVPSKMWGEKISDGARFELACEVIVEGKTGTAVFRQNRAMLKAAAVSERAWTAWISEVRRRYAAAHYERTRRLFGGAELETIGADAGELSLTVGRVLAGQVLTLLEGFGEASVGERNSILRAMESFSDLAKAEANTKLKAAQAAALKAKLAAAVKARPAGVSGKGGGQFSQADVLRLIDEAMGVAS